MTSPPNAAYVPYQAYRSKRHSRNLSSSTALLSPSQSPPPFSILSNGAGGTAALLQHPMLSLGGEVDNNAESATSTGPNHHDVAVRSPGVFASDQVRSSSSSPAADKGMASIPDNDPLVAPSLSNVSDVRLPTTKKTSTFRRLPITAARSTTPHTRNASLPSLPSRITEDPQKDVMSPSPTPVVSPDSPRIVLLSQPKIQIQDSRSHSSQASITSTSHILPIEPPSIVKTTSSFSSADPESSRDKPLPIRPRRTAPYRPGFQPKGIYRSLTDDFFELRRAKRDGEGDSRMKRVERTKLERRLEKLIALHFPSPVEQDNKLSVSHPPNRRASIFDFGSLKNMNFNDAGDLWKGIVVGNVMDSAKNDIRIAEQRITPWQDDTEVNKCPLCLASFHPITNRKHHCRLCGRVVCSLPIKHPQRIALCSTLFVVDKQTRQIEEVGEGVDYGVRKRRASGVTNQQVKFEEDTKFLKGVRVCRECRPVLLRQQYRQQAQIIPPFVDMYQRFISLEAEIEDALTKFQELIVLLNHANPPLQEATSARKHLLDSFAQYDKLAKKFRSLSCPNGPGSSQDRVQMAIVMRANLFLQKNMFPLQSLSALRSNLKAAQNPDSHETESSNLPRDMDAALAHRLQPLLEQESLLEVFIEEARAQRKFEDVKALTINLAEIRREIEKLLDTSDPHRNVVNNHRPVI